MPSCPRKTDRLAIRLIALATLGGMVAGCSDLYFDRRESISLASGDAIAANKAAQMVDPWPASSVKRDVAYNGEKMQGAVERYRQGRTIPPVNATTSSLAYQQAQQAANSASSGQGGSSGAWSPPPTPSVK
jgi:hypothetical protein